jgi:uncharacterized protein (TIGR00251 family)
MRINIRVTPNASQNKIKIETYADGSVLYRVYVTTIPEDGKANKEVIKLLAKHFGLSKSSFTIVRGETTKDKIIDVLNDL